MKTRRRRRRRRRRRQERGAVRRPNCTTASDLLQGPCLALGRSQRVVRRAVSPILLPWSRARQGLSLTRSGVEIAAPAVWPVLYPADPSGRPTMPGTGSIHGCPWAPVGGGTGGGTPFQVGSPPSSPSPPTKLGTLEPALAVGPESPPRGGPDGKPPLPTVALVLQFEPLPGMEQLRAGQASAHLMNLEG